MICRDLTSTRNQKLKISNSQLDGIAVPHASMHPVTCTADVLALMNRGSNRRSVGATAMNESSSRSHSVLTVHVRGKDLKTNGVLRGNLHLVDLDGNERVDRSKATGERLKEAQHINKSLSNLGLVFVVSSLVKYCSSRLVLSFDPSNLGHWYI